MFKRVNCAHTNWEGRKVRVVPLEESAVSLREGRCLFKRGGCEGQVQ